MPKPSQTSVPILTTDKAAEEFLEKDLSMLDFARFRPVRLTAPQPETKPLT